MYGTLKKKYGQNFLIDKNIVKKIINLVRMKDKNIIEIGPGRGALTEEIIKQKPKSLCLIEKDDDISFSSKQIEVILQVDKIVSDYFRRRNILPNQTTVKELEEGGLLVSTKVSYDEEILKLVRYWIPNVKIISPAYLQDKLLSGLKKYMEIK